MIVAGLESQSKMKVSVVIGRYQILHLGHEEVFKKALENSDELIILIGSFNNVQRTIKNPFLSIEREQMVLNATSSLPVMNICHLKDFQNDNDGWVKQVKTLVNDSCKSQDEIILVGHNRDDSSFYLDLFPDWKFFEVGKLAGDISASEIRNIYFSDQNIENIKKYVSASVFNYLVYFKKTKKYQDILKIMNKLDITSSTN